MWHVWGRGEVHSVFWYGNLRERTHLEDLGVDGRTILNNTNNIKILIILELNRMEGVKWIDVSE
jgi:hypothetical protein